MKAKGTRSPIGDRVPLTTLPEVPSPKGKHFKKLKYFKAKTALLNTHKKSTRYTQINLDNSILII